MHDLQVTPAGLQVFSNRCNFGLFAALDRKAIEREVRGEGEKPFWRNALRQLPVNCVELALLAGLPLRFDLLGDIVRSGPQNLKQVEDPAWRQQSVCWQCIEEAERRLKERDEDARIDFEQCRGYWCNDFAALAGETRSSIIMSFTMLTNLFTTRPLRRLLATDTTLTPEASFASNASLSARIRL